jgi:hypothetical protein
MNWLRKLICSHEFRIKDIALTNIPLPAEPVNGSFNDWQEYHTNYYVAEGNTKRVSCACHKCGEIQYAHCGLDLKGKLI